MAWDSDDLSALEDAIKKGAKRVKYKDGEIEYHSLKEMMQLRRAMQRELGNTSKTRRLTPEFSKGLNGSCDED